METARGTNRTDNLFSLRLFASLLRHTQRGGAAGSRDAPAYGAPRGVGDHQQPGAVKATGYSGTAEGNLNRTGSSKFPVGGKGKTKMKRMIWQLALFILLCLPFPVSAQNGTETERAVLERWRQMSPEERQDLKKRYRRWKSLSPEKKTELRQKLETWRGLAPEQKDSVRRNFRRWRNLSPENRERLRKRWERWSGLPPEQRERLKKRFEKFRSLPPAERREWRKRFHRGQGLTRGEKRKLRERLQEKRKERHPKRSPQRRKEQRKRGKH